MSLLKTAGIQHPDLGTQSITIDGSTGAVTFPNGGPGDLTEVQAGTGISVASGTGPIPVVTNSMATEITAKGDLIVGTGSGTFDNLPVAADGSILVADSSTATGLAFAAPAAGGGGMTLIQTISPNEATSVSFTSIATTYKQLYVLFRGVVQNYGTDSIVVRLNDSSAGKYQMFSIEKFTTSIGANVYEDATQLHRVINNTGNNAATKARTTSGYFSVLDADQVSDHALEFWSGGVDANGVACGTAGRGLFYPTTAAAISRIDFINLSAQGMTGTFQLYGVN